MGLTFSPQINFPFPGRAPIPMLTFIFSLATEKRKYVHPCRVGRDLKVRISRIGKSLQLLQYYCFWAPCVYILIVAIEWRGCTVSPNVTKKCFTQNFMSNLMLTLNLAKTQQKTLSKKLLKKMY